MATAQVATSATLAAGEVDAKMQIEEMLQQRSRLISLGHHFAAAAAAVQQVAAPASCPFHNGRHLHGLRPRSRLRWRRFGVTVAGCVTHIYL